MVPLGAARDCEAITVIIGTAQGRTAITLSGRVCARLSLLGQNDSLPVVRQIRAGQVAYVDPAHALRRTVRNILPANSNICSAQTVLCFVQKLVTSRSASAWRRLG